MEEKKPFFLIKMCDKYEEKMTRFYFNSTVSYYPWPEKDHGVLPKDLVPRILEKLKKVSSSSIEGKLERVTIGPKKEELGDAISRKDLAK